MTDNILLTALLAATVRRSHLEIAVDSYFKIAVTVSPSGGGARHEADGPERHAHQAPRVLLLLLLVLLLLLLLLLLVVVVVVVALL